MKKEFSDKIDKLTASLEDVVTGKIYATSVTPLVRNDLKHLAKKSGWRFNWKEEFDNEMKAVYKLTLVDEPDTIQGLISLVDAGDHVFMFLVETAPHNYGKKKKFYGVLGNLVAFAYKLSFEKGYNGEVAFISKTALIEHYEKQLGAVVLTGQRLAIFTEQAKKLVTLYYKDFRHESW